MGLLPIAIPAAVLAVMALDRGGVSDGAWDGTAVRIKNTKAREYFGTESTKELEKWLSANPGGGKTDFGYSGYSKALFEVPEISFDKDDLLENPVVIVAGILFLTEIALAQQAGVTSVTGFLGFGAGQFIKLIYDGWNAIAPGMGLGGAVLRY